MGNPLIKRQGGRKFKKLNDFVENSTFEVHTKRTRDKQGRERGKVIDWQSTIEDWKHEAQNDCKYNTNDDYKRPGDCEKDTLLEDHPEFCLFGSRCVNEAVRKAIDKESKNYTDVKFDDIPDEVIELMMQKELEQDEVF